MEPERVKARHDSSPCSASSSSSTLEFDIDGKIPLDNNPSIKPKSDGKSSSSPPEPVSPPNPENETGLQSPPSRPEPISPQDIPNPGPETGLQGSSQGPAPVPSPMKSPPVQTMGTPPGYDPNRIPASIFSTKPTNPAEWSTNSNESLFSITMGNNSFSRDYAILYGKSGELAKLEDPSTNLPNLPQIPESKSNELTSSLPPVLEHEESGINSGELSRTETKNECDSPKVVQRENVEVHVNEKKAVEPNLPLSKNPSTLPSPPRLSDESGNSGSSFQFPVLVNDGGKGGSLKAVPEKPEKPPQSEPDVSKEATKASEKGWFSCCCSWPRCC